jgi:hypothetical protein
VGSGKRVSRMERVNLLFPMETYTKEIGKVEKCMERAFMLVKGASLRANGNMET